MVVISEARGTIRFTVGRRCAGAGLCACRGFPLRGGVAAGLPLAGVVDQELGDLAERAALLAEVYDEPDAAALRAPDALLDRVGEVRPTPKGFGRRTRRRGRVGDLRVADRLRIAGVRG
jgi:hypothetical protein